MRKYYKHDFDINKKYYYKTFYLDTSNTFKLAKTSDEVKNFIRSNLIKNYEIIVNFDEKYALMTYNI